MTISTQLPPPENWQDFENLCCDLWRKEWGEAQRWGTSGEEQHGVDIVNTASGRAIQCKLKNQLRGARLKPEQVLEEIEKAKMFRPKLRELIFATTAPRNSKDQQTIAAIDAEQKKKRSFRVKLYAWDDIVPLLELHPEVKNRYYGPRPKPLRTPLPELPEHLVTRPEVLERLKAKIAGADKPKIGLWGMGGSGKSVLAAAVAHDQSVRQRFRDGVLWLNVGLSDPLSLLSLLARTLTDTPDALANVRQGKQIVQGLAAERAILLVLDDVWTDEQALALDVVGPEGGLIVTTRLSAVVERFGAEHIEVGTLSDDQAELLLESWGGDRPPSSGTAAAIVAECGNLPLALAMAGALARRPNRTWDDALQMLRSAKLEKLETRFPEYPYPTMLAAIDVSIRDLQPEEQKHYLDLVAFGSEWVPTATLEAIWGNSDLVTTLVERSLAFLDNRNRLRLHDLQADYVRSRAGDPTPFHRRVVEMFRRRVGDFANAMSEPDGGYILQRLPHHLAAAGMQDELQRLLFDFQWLSAKLAVIDVNALIADYALVPLSTSAQLVRKALRLAAQALAKDSQQLAGQLLSRLRSGNSEVDRLLAGALAWGRGKTWLRPTRPGLSPAGGCLQQTFEGNAGGVRKLVSRGDVFLDVYCKDGLIRTWNIESGSLAQSASYIDTDDEQDFPPFLSKLESRTCWMSLDAKRIVAGSYGRNGRITVWDAHTGQLLQDIDCAITCPVSHPVISILVLDERRVLTGSRGGYRVMGSGGGTVRHNA
jgi:hypothetical protein